MNVLHTILLATSFFAMPLPANTTGEAVLSAAGDPVRTEVGVEASRDALTDVLRERIRFPRFAAEPHQEVIVRIRFQVDGDNRIDLIDVQGNDARVADYVREHLDGMSVAEQPVLGGVTFSTTLRFVH